MHEKEKTVEVRGQRYRLKLMSAMIGSWIHDQLVFSTLAYAQKQPSSEEPSAAPESELTSEETAAIRVRSFWAVGAPQLEQSVYQRILTECLRTVSNYPDGGQPVAVMHEKHGLVEELATDGSAVRQLVIEVLLFNLSPFFLDDALTSKPPARTTTPSNASR